LTQVARDAAVGAEQGEVGTIAGGDPTELVVEAEVGGGVQRRHAQRVLERQAEQLDAVADRGGEVDVGAPR
jgi:hypothetical protein